MQKCYLLFAAFHDKQGCNHTGCMEHVAQPSFITSCGFVRGNPRREWCCRYLLGALELVKLAVKHGQARRIENIGLFFWLSEYQINQKGKILSQKNVKGSKNGNKGDCPISNLHPCPLYK